MKTSNFTKWAVIFGFVVALAGCGGGGGGSDDDDDDDSGGQSHDKTEYNGPFGKI